MLCILLYVVACTAVVHVYHTPKKILTRADIKSFSTMLCASNVDPFQFQLDRCVRVILAHATFECHKSSPVYYTVCEYYHLTLLLHPTALSFFFRPFPLLLSCGPRVFTYVRDMYTMCNTVVKCEKRKRTTNTHIQQFQVSRVCRRNRGLD